MRPPDPPDEIRLEGADGSIQRIRLADLRSRVDAMADEDLDPEQTAAALRDAIAAERAAWSDPREDGAHESFQAPLPTAEAIDRIWLDYWVPLLRGEDGAMSLERLKAELYDAYHLVTEARKVYRHVTGGLTDDLTASAEGIIAISDQRVADLVAGLRSELERAQTAGQLLWDRAEALRGVVQAAASYLVLLDAHAAGADTQAELDVLAADLDAKLRELREAVNAAGAL